MDSSGALERYVSRAMAGDLVGASGVVNGLMQAGWSAHRVYEELLAPGQRILGERWRRGEIDVSEEHLATQIGLALMSQLREALPSQRQHGRSVGVATVEGDYHDLGARMVADYFLADGWSVLYLGPSLPVGSLVRAVQTHRLDVVCLSCSLAPLLTELSDAATALGTLQSAPALIFGGAAITPEVALDLRHVAGAVVANPAEAVVNARRLVGLPVEGSSLEATLLTIGQAIRRLRRERGWSQEQLAAAAGLDRTYITTVELGKQNITMRALVTVAAALRVSPPELFGTD